MQSKIARQQNLILSTETLQLQPKGPYIKGRQTMETSATSVSLLQVGMKCGAYRFLSDCSKASLKYVSPKQIMPLPLNNQTRKQRKRKQIKTHVLSDTLKRNAIKKHILKSQAY